MKIEFHFLKTFYYFYLGKDGVHIEIEPYIFEKRKSNKILWFVLSFQVLNIDGED